MTEPTESSVVAHFLVRTLQQIQDRPLKGSELSVLVKTAYPGFKPENYGHRNLRDFIRVHAPEIAEFDRAGMDIVYVLRETKDRLTAEGASTRRVASPAEQLTQNTRVWKTFTRPDSLFRLFLLPESGLLRVLHPNQNPLPEWREIPRISAEALLQIGRGFTEDLPDVQRQVLAPLLDQPQWWVPFFDRIVSLGLRPKWVEYRRRRVRDEFQKRIAEAGLATRSTPTPEREPVLATTTSGDGILRPSELSIRKVAADVVQRMTESELRALNLPLGYVLDSLTTR